MEIPTFEEIEKNIAAMQKGIKELHPSQEEIKAAKDILRISVTQLRGNLRMGRDPRADEICEPLFEAIEKLGE